MTICASVAFCKNEFVAVLSDGRQIERSEFRDMAHALHGAGVLAAAVQYEWHAGQRMMTAGQQVALRAEMRRLERIQEEQSVAA
jgi:hypothetical protein